MNAPAAVSRLAALLALGATLLPSALAAQASGPSVLTLLPVDDRVIQVGETVTGNLDEGLDLALPGGQPVQAWEARGPAGSRVWIDLVSNDFDAYLWALDPDRGTESADDDSGGACNARLSAAFPDSGRLLVVVSRTGFQGQGGAFTLSVLETVAPAVDAPCGGASSFAEPQSWSDVPETFVVVGTLSTVPADTSGSLDAGGGGRGPMGGAMATWELSLEAGQELRIELTSDDFDTVLAVSGPGGTPAYMNDDGGDGTNSFLRFTAEASGVHHVHVSAFSQDSGGSYRLRITPVDGADGAN
jgi:hypothetical protein